MSGHAEISIAELEQVIFSKAGVISLISSDGETVYRIEFNADTGSLSIVTNKNMTIINADGAY